MGSALLWKRRYDATPMQSGHVNVQIDLGRIRENVSSIARETGVDVIAVVKSDAYGLGAGRVSESIVDLVWGFCVFSLSEAKAAGLWELSHKPTLSLGPSIGIGPDEFVAAGVHPAVCTEK
jgi:alanine racemase